jgi:hypothetical protein
MGIVLAKLRGLAGFALEQQHSTIRGVRPARRSNSSPRA